jgi:hypothetical protein
MAAFRVIPAGDLALAQGSFVIADGVEYIRQKLGARFKFFLGEWFLDKREGVPYFRDVFVKNPNLDVIRSLFRRVALSVPGVLSVPAMTVSYDRPARSLAFAFRARVTGGVVEVSAGDRDFIVDVGA